MTMLKKTLSLLLAVLLAFGTFSGALAQALPEQTVSPAKSSDTAPATREVHSGTCGDNLTWTLDTGTGILAISGTGDMQTYGPSSAPWADYSSSITSAIIGSGVTSIGAYSFYGCGSLTSVSIPNSVTIIKWYAFGECGSLSSITIPEGVTSIGANAFSECSSLTAVTIPESMLSIGQMAFAGCSSLPSINIPAGVAGISNRAFTRCSSLTSINVSANNQNYSSVDGVLFDKSETTLICCPGGRTGGYIIPDGVTSLYNYAFDNCGYLTSITIPDGITDIDWYVFYCCCSLTSITIPEEVTSIGYEAFYGCSSLASVLFLGAPPESIHSTAFEGCASDLRFYYTEEHASEWAPNGETTWNGYPIALYEEPVSNIVSGDCGEELTWTLDTDTGLLTISGTGSMWDWNSLEAVPWYSYSSSITSVEIDSGVTDIGCFAFAVCTSLTSVNIPGTVTNIDWYAFAVCTSLTSITIPEGVTSIENAAFTECSSLTSVEISDSVTSIGKGAFSSCTSLTSVTIPDSVTSIGDEAFYNCGALTSTIFLGTPPESFGANVFSWCASGFTIYYTADHASEWAPNGETTWNGYPIRLLGSEPDPTPTPTPEPTATPEPNEGGYYLVTDAADITTGDYVIYGVNEAEGYSGAMNNTISNGRMGASAVTIENDTVIDPDPSVIWHFEQQQDGSFTLYNAAAGVFCMISANSTSGFSTGETATYGFNIYPNENVENAFCMHTTMEGVDRMISIYQTNFRSYYLTNLKPLYLYKRVTGEDPTPDPYEMGDVNEDGIVNASDALMIVRYAMVLATLTEDQLIRADLDGNGVVSISDAMVIMRAIIAETHTPVPLDASPDGTAAIRVSSASGWQGDTVDIILSITGNYSASTFAIFVEYDTELLSINGITRGQVLSSITDSGQIASCSTATAGRIAFTALTPEENCSVQGYILTVQFRISYDAPYGIQIPITAIVESLSNDDSDGTVHNVLQSVSNGIVNVYAPAVPHIVTFVDWDGTVLSTQTVGDGEAATAPADPYREGYTFIGWDVDFTNVTSDLTVTALYEPVHVPGDLNGDGKVDLSDVRAIMRYMFGMISLNSEQLAEADQNGDGIVTISDALILMRSLIGETHTPAASSVTEDGTADVFVSSDSAFPGDSVDVVVTISGDYTASALLVHLEYDTELLTFESISEGSVWDSIMMGDSTTIYRTDVPGRISFAAVSRDSNFSGEGELFTATFRVADGAASGTEIPVTATVEQFTLDDSSCNAENILRSVTNGVVLVLPGVIHTVTFVDWDGTVLSTQTVGDGQAATAPADPYREGYNFIGWDVDFTNVTSDLTVTALYLLFDPISDDMFEEGVMTIPEVIASADSTEVTVVAQLVYRFGNYDSINTAILEDIVNGEICGLQTYNALENFRIGDILKITATKTTYGGVPQIQSAVSVEKLGHAERIPAQRFDNFSDLLANKENLVSEYVMVKNVTLGAYNNSGSTMVTDSNGDTMPIYRAASYDAFCVEAGEVVDLYAALSRYSSTWQFRGGKYVGENTPDTDDEEVIIGDVNEDGVIDAFDALMIVRYSMGFMTLSADQLLAADINGDENVNLSDALMLMRIILGMIGEGHTPVPAQVTGEGTATVYAGSASGDPGDTVEISVFVSGEYSASALTVFIEYDPELLTLTDTLSRGDVWDEILDAGGMTISNTETDGSIGFIAVSPYEDFTSEGCIFTAVFRISESAIPFTTESISVTVETFSDDGPDGAPYCVLSSVMDGSVSVTLPEGFHMVYFVDWDGTVLSTQMVEEGNAAVAPADPVREGYTFTGWDADFANVTSDLTITALYEVGEPVGLLEIGIDAGHANYGVSGNYAGAQTAFVELCAKNGIHANYIQAGELTYDNIKDYVLLVLTVPYVGWENVGEANLYTEAELEAIAQYAANGGSIIVCSKSDRGNPDNIAEQAHVISNAILEAIGTDTRIAGGIVVDNVNKVNEAYRIYFTDEENYSYTWNGEPVWLLDNVLENTNNVFSGYNSAPVIAGANAIRVIKGYSTTWGASYTADFGESSSYVPDYDNDTVVVPMGEVTVVSLEDLPGGGWLIASGKTFLFKIGSSGDFTVEDQMILNIIEKLKSDYEPKVYTGVCGDEATWIYDTETGVLTINGTGFMYDFDYDNQPWSRWQDEITSVEISEGILSIGTHAFFGCTSLESVNIPNSVISIGDLAFMSCESLTSVDIPGSVETIGDGAFGMCYRLAEVTLHEGLVSIGDSAFVWCGSLTSITIPDSVVSILTSFVQCGALTSINVGSGNNVFSSVDGVLFDKSESTLICCPGGKTGDYTVPYGVTAISDIAFCGCWLLNSVSISESVTQIGEFAFAWCESLTLIDIPESVEQIGEGAFEECSSLTDITIPEGVTELGPFTFYNCTSLTEICIPEGVTELGQYIFYNCSALTEICIPEGVTVIREYAFANCSSLSSAVFLGAPPELSGSDLFTDCASDFTIYYTADHASEWAPNGETTWNGYPIRLLGSEPEPTPTPTPEPDPTPTPEPTVPPESTLVEGFYFETDPLEEGWQFVDMDGDGYCWNWIRSSAFSFEGEGVIYSMSYSSQTSAALYPDNWAVSPYVALPSGNITLTLYAMAYDPDYSAERFGIFISTAANPAVMVQVGADVTVDEFYRQYEFDLDEFAGQEIRICIRHYNVSDEYMLLVDQVELWESGAVGPYTVTYTGVYNGSETVEHGGSVTLPVFDGDGLHYVFTVDGEPWDGTNITGDVTVTVEFEINVYTVDFYDPIAEALIDSQQVMYGYSASAPEAPEHYGYVFECWDADFDYVTSDMTVNAVYEKLMFTVTFYDTIAQAQITTQQTAFGESATAPEAPEHYGYDFVGWDTDFSCVTQDITVSTVYAAHCFTVIFTDGLGNVISTQSVPYLGSAEEPSVPEAPYGMTFSGWDEDFSCIEADTIVNAIWEQLPDCIVTFIGAYTGTVTVPYGEDCELPVYPSDTVHYTFMVDGEYWDGECVTSDITVVVSAAPNSVRCTVTFVDWDGTVLGTVTVKYGEAAPAPEVPEREGYYFVGWDKDISFIKHDMTVTAVYTQEDPNMTAVSGSVIWRDNNDQDGVRPESVMIYLMANGAAIDFVTVTEADGWSYSFTDLPKYDNGSLINYSIYCSSVDGYLTAYSGKNVILTHAPETISFPVYVNWDDDDNSFGSRPESVTVTLYANGVDTGITVVLSEENDWMAGFDNVDRYANGEEITYSIAVEEIPGYEILAYGSQYDRFIINCVYTPTGLVGDVDCDGDIDFDDVTLLNAYLLNAAELSEQGLINANVNGDNKVSSADVVALNKLILGSN